MGHTVTVTGTLVAVSGLPGRDEQRTVEVTDRIRGLVHKGYLAVLEGSLDAPPSDHTGVTEDDPSGVSPLPTGDFAPDGSDQTLEPEPVRPPGRNASRDTWAAFLDSRKPPLEYPADADRPQLQHIWNQSLGGS